MGVGVWPPVAGGPLPRPPPTCVEHFDLLLCLPQPSGQSDLCFLQPPVRDGHQRRAGSTAAVPTPQPPRGCRDTPSLCPHRSVTLGEKPAGGRRDLFKPCYSLMLRGLLPRG